MIVLAPHHLAAIAEAAEAAFPAEGCGLLIGGGRRIIRVSRVVPAANLCRDQRPDRFELDPAIRIALERQVRGTDQRVVGHWHSHPDGSATPSATDIDHAWEPDLIWLIAGTTAGVGGRGQMVQLRAHRLDRTTGRSRPVALKVG